MNYKANNIIILLAILISKNFSKREHIWKFSSSGLESILFAILNNLQGSEKINDIFVL